MNNFSMFLCFTVTIAAVGATIYNQLCPDHIQHARCLDGLIHFDRNCPPGVKIKNFTRALQNVIVSAHNEKRQYIASGNELKLSPACRMAKMSWKPKLAEAAEADIRQYKMGTDLCNNAAASIISRQSIASWIVDRTVNETHDLISAVQSFYNEVENVNQAYIDSYPENYNGPKINSFMRMMVDNNKAVGCALGVFPMINGPNNYFKMLLCNYARSYTPGSPVYSKCNIAGEGCIERNTRYLNLCASNETSRVD